MGWCRGYEYGLRRCAAWYVRYGCIAKDKRKMRKKRKRKRKKAHGCINKPWALVKWEVGLERV